MSLVLAVLELGRLEFEETEPDVSRVANTEVGVVCGGWGRQGDG